MGITLLPPDINEGFGNFSVSGNQIRFGLASGLIKADGFDESNIYQLMIGIHPANLLMISNKDMNEEELEVSRADFIREHLPTIH